MRISIKIQFTELKQQKWAMPYVNIQAGVPWLRFALCHISRVKVGKRHKSLFYSYYDATQNAIMSRHTLKSEYSPRASKSPTCFILTLDRSNYSSPIPSCIIYGHLIHIDAMTFTHCLHLFTLWRLYIVIFHFLLYWIEGIFIFNWRKTDISSVSIVTDGNFLLRKNYRIGLCLGTFFRVQKETSGSLFCYY